MAFDLNQFLQGGLIYGGARPSKFDVTMVTPSYLALNGVDVTQKLNFTCKAASIPSFTIGEVLIPYFGRKIKSAGDRTWDDWEITVMLDEDYITRQVFEAWSNSINQLEANQMQNGIDTGSTTLPGEAYKTTWTINHYSKDNIIIASYTLEGCWPRMVGNIVLDWDGTDRISQFVVRLAYDYLTPVKGLIGKGNSITYDPGSTGTDSSSTTTI